MVFRFLKKVLILILIYKGGVLILITLTAVTLKYARRMRQTVGQS
jgi:hypothetical protein